MIFIDRRVPNKFIFCFAWGLQEAWLIMSLEQSLKFACCSERGLEVTNGVVGETSSLWATIVLFFPKIIHWFSCHLRYTVDFKRKKVWGKLDHLLIGIWNHSWLYPPFFWVIKSGFWSPCFFASQYFYSSPFLSGANGDWNLAWEPSHHQVTEKACNVELLK